MMIACIIELKYHEPGFSRNASPGSEDSEMTHDLAGQVIAVTGAGKGLGRAYALYLAGRGARVVVNNRRHAGEVASSADCVVEQIRAAGGDAVAEYSAVERPDSGERLLETALRNYGKLDAVVANAGISERRSFHKQDLASVHKVIDINLAGTINIVHPAFRYMYERGSGSLLLSSSVAGLYGEHGLPAYSASKAAVLGLMYSLSQEGSLHGVRVNAVAPYAATAMTDAALTEELKLRLAPERIAPLVAWLVSAACPLNGEILIAGAGRVARASMMESAPLTLPLSAADGFNADHDLWARLQAEPIDRKYKGAVEQFLEFTRPSSDAEG
jgi:NAD(P)-dependent dehydrogenase (short-subunit alcohol dehydrogenase family)